MQFHYINTNERFQEEGRWAYKTWLNLGYGFTNGARQYGEKLGSFEPGDLVFMYVNKMGIKAVGMVIKPWDGIEFKQPIIPGGDNRNEYRVQINWFIVLPDGFVSPSNVKDIIGYSLTGTTARINGIAGEKLLRHILAMLE